MRRWPRRILAATGTLALLGVAGSAGTLLWLRTASGNAALRDLGVWLVNEELAGTLDVGMLSTDLWSHARLGDVTITGPDGAILLTASAVDVTLSFPRITSIEVSGLEVWLDVASDGTVPLLEVLTLPDLHLLPEIQVPEVEAVGTIHIGELLLNQAAVGAALTVDGGLAFSGIVLEANVEQLPEPLHLEGSAWVLGSSVETSLAATTSGSRFEVAGVATEASLEGAVTGEADLGVLGFEGRIAVSGSVKGPYRALKGEAEMAGVTIALSGDLAARSWEVEARLRNFEPPIETAVSLVADGACQVSGTQLRGVGQCDLQVASSEIRADLVMPVQLGQAEVHLPEVVVRTLGGEFIADARASLAGVEATIAGEVPLASLGIPGVLGRGGIAATASGRPEAIRFSGTMTSSAAALHETQITGVNGRFSGVAKEGVVVASADATVARVSTAGLTVSDLSMPISIAWSGEGIRLQGPVNIGDVQGHGLSVRETGAVLEATVIPDRPLQAVVYASSVVEARGVEAEASVQGVLIGGQAGFDATLIGAGLTVKAEGAADLASGVVEMSAIEVTPPHGERWTQQTPGRARLTNDGLTDVQVSLALGEGHAVARGSLDDLEVSLADVPLAMVQQLSPTLPALSGRSDARIGLSKDGISGEVRVVDLALPGVTGTVSIDEGRVEGVVHRENALVAEIIGEVGSTLEEPIDLAIRVRELDLGVFHELDLPAYPQVTSDLAVRGPLRALEIAGDARIRGLGTTTDLTITQRDEEFRVTGVSRADELGLATFSGSVEVPLHRAVEALLEGRPVPEPLVSDPNGQALLEAIPVHALVLNTGLDADLEGTFDGEVSLVDGRVSAELAWNEGRAGTVTVPEASVRISDGQFSLQSAFQTRVPGRRRTVVVETGTVSVSGALPLRIDLLKKPMNWLEAPVALNVTGRGIPLGVLSAVHPGLKDGSGWLALNGHVGGTPSEPDLGLEAGIEDGAVTIRDLGLRMRGLSMAASLRGEQASLEQLSAYLRPSKIRRLKAPSGRPSLSASGQARVGVDGVTEIAGDANLNNALVVSRVGQYAWLSTETPLTLRGSLSDLHVAGALRVERARVALDKPTLMELELWDGPARRVDPVLDVIRSTASETPPPRTPLWSYFDADLGVDLGSDCTGSLALPYFEEFGVLGAEASTIAMEGTLIGALDVTVAEGVPRVRGQLDVARGHAMVLRSGFTINDGTIVFVDGDPFQPFVNVGATMGLVSGGEIAMTLRGTPAGAEVHFTSTDLSQQDQILTTVITGQDPTRTDTFNVAGGLAMVLGTQILFGEYFTGKLKYREGMLQYELPLGPRLRMTPKLGIGTAFSGDLFAVDARWLVSPSLSFETTMGTATKTIGLMWQRRY